MDGASGGEDSELPPPIGRVLEINEKLLVLSPTAASKRKARPQTRDGRPIKDVRQAVGVKRGATAGTTKNNPSLLVYKYVEPRAPAATDDSSSDSSVVAQPQPEPQPPTTAQPKPTPTPGPFRGYIDLKTYPWLRELTQADLINQLGVDIDIALEAAAHPNAVQVSEVPTELLPPTPAAVSDRKVLYFTGSHVQQHPTGLETVKATMTVRGVPTPQLLSSLCGILRRNGAEGRPVDGILVSDTRNPRQGNVEPPISRSARFCCCPGTGRQSARSRTSPLT